MILYDTGEVGVWRGTKLYRIILEQPPTCDEKHDWNGFVVVPKSCIRSAE